MPTGKAPQNVTASSILAMVNSQPIELVGNRIRLTPLSEIHLPALWEAGHHPEIWQLAMNIMENEQDMERYVRIALREQAEGRALPFATTLLETGEIIGSTRFGNIEPAHKRVEIGWTWITPSYQRSFVNTEAKYLMLSHAFDIWDVNRVELKTDVLNTKSRNAMLRIGAKEEAVLRHHVIRENGTVRDNIFCSILKSEWPDVKQNLEEMMRK